MKTKTTTNNARLTLGQTSRWARVCAALVLSAAMAIAVSAQVTTLHRFDGTDGSTPYGALVQGIDGNLYGTTEAGGTNGAGTVFIMTTGGTVTTIYNFCSLASCTDGANPNAGLVQDTDGNFYGTTFGDDNPTCGGSGCGTVFKITPGGTLTTLHSFCALSSCLDGANPTAALVQGTDGNLYGTTSAFGKDLEGTVFKITTSGKLTTLHTFIGTDGNSPYGGVIQGIDGNFYGTTGYGGASGNGTVFKMTPTGQLTKLHSFNGADGANPYGGLVQLPYPSYGYLYGTTYAGGASGYGTIFEIAPTGNLHNQYSFCSLAACADGANPSAGLQTFGNIAFGTTSYGGANGDGVLFQFNLGGLEEVAKYSFCSKTACADGSFPLAALVEDTNDNLYGTASGGGNGFGTVFSFPSGGVPFVEPLPNYGKVGASIQILGTNLTGATKVTIGGVNAVFKVVFKLDARGSVWITLPKYFQALNRDFRYQLTSIGRPQPSLYVAREISGNRFRISGGKPGGKVSWQVTGIRHDAYAEAHRIQVEEEKPPQEQGHYLHPELFGAGPEQAVGYHAPPVSTQRPTKAETAHVPSLKTPPAEEQQREFQHQPSVLRAQAAAIRNLKSELRTTRQTLQKVKAQLATAQPALVATK